VAKLIRKNDGEEEVKEIMATIGIKYETGGEDMT